MTATTGLHEFDSGFGAELAALRAERGVSFEELSRRAHVSRTYLQDIAHGRRGHAWPSQAIVDRIAVALDVEPDHFAITRVRAVLAEPDVLEVAYGNVKKVRRLRAKASSR